MTEYSDRPHPPDICLLLRAHGEQRWLSSALVPLLQDLEEPGRIPEDQLGAALAYLELLWLDARRRAADTDAACTRLAPPCVERDPVLCEKAHRYHAAVRRMRVAVETRVQRLTCFPEEAAWHEHASS